ncbi:hypothetical protein [Ewingella americana]|uniref:Uncharacterized protein n=1 Tax=Ewingella americana TaxID=41202 RepID=A0A502GEV4_9GAMM|nr:hypothetical protein [Ewingella americana]TPG60152.1 hypothetical protein EAH77_16415 [Ewingella americana]
MVKSEESSLRRQTPSPVIEQEIIQKLQTMTIGDAEKADRKGFSMVLMSNYISQAYRTTYLSVPEVVKKAIV